MKKTLLPFILFGLFSPSYSQPIPAKPDIINLVKEKIKKCCPNGGISIGRHIHWLKVNGNDNIECRQMTVLGDKSNE
jgi:hypothetical protein